MAQERTLGILKLLVVFLCVIIVGLVVAVFFIVNNLHQEIASTKTGECPADHHNINLDPPDVLPPFHDLTPGEMKAVKDYLYDQFGASLVRPDQIRVNNSYIFTMELNIPPKTETLAFLDMNKPQPDREALVVIMRGDLDTPVVEEYVVGPLPAPTAIRKRVTVPFVSRPLTLPEMNAATDFLMGSLKEVDWILEESYGGKLLDCGDTCFTIALITPVSPVATKYKNTRKMWFWLSPMVEFPTVQPYDFRVLIDMTSEFIEDYKIDNVIYGNAKFDSLGELARRYKAGTVKKTKVSFPKNDEKLFSSMKRRGTLFPEKPMSPPIEYEPSGKRYSINGRHVSYMLWDFDLRMSTLTGPQLYDIRFNGKRIVYELSLQDLAAFYSAHNPAIRHADYLDSVFLIGSRARSLMPGVDCPAHATFLSVDHVFENLEEPFRYERSMCVFEHNTGIPLRRHLTSTGGSDRFYEGMVDVVLTVRTIPTVENYDYIMDFVFHQNGAIEVQVISTGYIITSFRFPSEDEYGFALREHITGNMHHHMFNFKVDMDINGRENRFETLDIESVHVDNSKWSAGRSVEYSQTKMVRHLVKTETEAAIKYNFSTPKYWTFYNKDAKSDTGAPRAYRLLHKGMSKQMFTEDMGGEASVPWARYQMAVTKRKEMEQRSSSIYAVWDPDSADFPDFLADNEDITDVDQVAWVTMGVHHIPHMEDFPTTPTVGLQLEFFLLPYNYFDEDPAIGSGDAVRAEPVDQFDFSKGVRTNRYGGSENAQCLPRSYSSDSYINEHPSSMFDPW